MTNDNIEMCKMF